MIPQPIMQKLYGADGASLAPRERAPDSPSGEGGALGGFSSASEDSVSIEEVD